MTLEHLNSEQRQYFWMSVCIGAALCYLAVKLDGAPRYLACAVGAVEFGCALAIYRRLKMAVWLYFVGCCGLITWMGMRLYTGGYSHMSAMMLVGGVLSLSGVYWLRVAMRDEEQIDYEPEEDDLDLFQLPAKYEAYHDSLIDSYEAAFGKPQWTHHIVSKTLWLHKFADHVITFPPTETRPTWLYGTLLISVMSEHPVELIIERPEEDTIGAVGALSMLTQYFIEDSPLEEWNTMGVHPFFGDASDVRGLLFSRPPMSLPCELQTPLCHLKLRYVAGITESQLTTAQTMDDELGGLAGAKALHADLKIAEDGITNLPN